jgi:hypothetical protein
LITDDELCKASPSQNDSGSRFWNNWISNNYFYSLAQLHALCVPGGCSFFLVQERTNQESEEYPLEPRNAQMVATLSLRSYLRESKQIQSLRSHFEEKCEHGSGTQ